MLLSLAWLAGTQGVCSNVKVLQSAILVSSSKVGKTTLTHSLVTLANSESASMSVSVIALRCGNRYAYKEALHNDTHDLHHN